MGGKLAILAPTHHGKEKSRDTPGWQVTLKRSIHGQVISCHFNLIRAVIHVFSQLTATRYNLDYVHLIFNFFLN